MPKRKNVNDEENSVWYWEDITQPPNERVHDWIDDKPYDEVIAEVITSMRAWLNEYPDDYDGYIVASLEGPGGEFVVITVTNDEYTLLPWYREGISERSS